MSVQPLSGGNVLSFLPPSKRDAESIAAGQSVGRVEYTPPGKMLQSVFSLCALQ